MEKLKSRLWAGFIIGLSVILTYAFISVMWTSTGYPSTDETYTIVEGDTLSTIGDRYGLTWKELWELNPQITDPNLIYIDQVIRISKDNTTTTIVVNIPLTQDEFKTKITELMFKESMLEEGDPIEILLEMKERVSILWDLVNRGNQAGIRRQITKLFAMSRRAEIHALADAITNVYEKDRERAYLLVALAWQESHFVNRRGQAGEVGFFQILPSTIKGIYGKDLWELKRKDIEDNPEASVEFANWYLTTLEKQYGSTKTALYRYNGHTDYAGYVLGKLAKVKRIVGR